MDLPFKTQPKPETHLVGTSQSGTLEMPKLYSATPNEELQIIPVLQATGSGKDPVAFLKCKRDLALIALQRVAPDATLEVIEELPLALVDQLFNYLLAERRGWEDPDPTEANDPKSTGASTSATSAPPSPTTTTASAAAGQPATPAKTSAKSRSKKSEPATKPTSKSEA